MIKIFKEMTDLAGTNPLSEAGIVQIHDGMVAPWFERFETIAGVATEIHNMVTYNLPRNHFATELDRYAAVTETGTKWAATRYLTPRRVTSLVVGDRGWVEAHLRALPFAKGVHLLDAYGNLLPGSWVKHPACR
jgi:zinc protease